MLQLQSDTVIIFQDRKTPRQRNIVPDGCFYNGPNTFRVLTSSAPTNEAAKGGGALKYEWV
jgi:hypothetical protein